MASKSGRSRGPRHLAALVAALAVTALGCDDPLPTLPEDVIENESAIIGGSLSGHAEDAVVQLRIGDEGLCSGTLVAPSLVLTARHCVSRTDEGLVCGTDGRAVRGGRVYEDRAAEDLVVYVGARAATLHAVARGADIVHDGATNLCDHDVAFVVLDRPVTTIAPRPIRLAETTRPGERITAVGWGLTRTGHLPKARMHRRDVAIVDVGPSPYVAPHLFLVGESICSGDSGGPALSASGAIVGVVSAGGNGHLPTANPASGCIGTDTQNQYTRIAPFRTLVMRAFAEVHAQPLHE